MTPAAPSAQPVLSFAQHREDVLLWRALRDIDPSGVAWVDVGAADPVLNSVTKWFSLQGWWGINVEPIPAQHCALVADRPGEVNLAAAVGREPGVLALSAVSENYELSTFDPSLAAFYRARGLTIETVAVPVMTLAAVFSEHLHPTGRVCGFVKIDAEGHEADVIAGADWDRDRPWIVMVEATKPETWRPALEARDYRLALDDGINLVFVADEAWTRFGELLSRPASVVDDHRVHLREIEAEERRGFVMSQAVAQVAEGLCGPTMHPGPRSRRKAAPTPVHTDDVRAASTALARLICARTDLQRAFAGDGRVNREAALRWATNNEPDADPELIVLRPHLRALVALLNRI